MTENQEPYEIKVKDHRIQETKDVAVQEGPYAVVMMAMQKGYTPELIEKMMDLQDRFEKNEARKAYVKAMAGFKANPPEILKTKHVSYVNLKNQKVEWDHAELGEICEAIIGKMSEHGLYHRWELEQPDKATVKTTCIITHELGHSEKTSMSGPPDISGGKDELKAVSSTNTLFQRLTLLALTGLAAKGMDNENPGNGSGGQPGPFEQWQIKCDESASAKADMGKWWSSNKAAVQKELSEAQAAKIYKAANAYKKQMDAEKAAPEPGSDG